MERPQSPAPRLSKRLLVAMAVLVIVTVVAVVQAPTWYRIWAGAQKGGFETLEADIAAQRQTIETLLENALGDYEKLGERVSVNTCYLHHDEHESGTMIIVRPIGIPPHEGAAAMANELERSGLRVESRTIGDEPIYSSEIEGFPLSLWFVFSDGPEPGIEVSLAGGCYTADRINATDPDSLGYQRGLRFLGGN